MQRGRRILLTAVVALAAGSIAFPAGAGAVADPQQDIAPGTAWFDGTAIQQPGQNCSVIGNPYNEIMVNGYGSYGGAPGGGVVRVNDQYWASLYIGIPGNPCGSGSTSVITDLQMPKNTAYDPSRPIRCYGTNRFSNDFFDITNQTWNFAGQSGRYCPTGPSQPFSGFGQGFGFRPLANGQQFMIFVPVKSSTVINGAGESGEQGQFIWISNASAAYAADTSSTFANVFPPGSGSGPQIYFTRNPSAQPFWDNTATAGTENRVEFWVNLFSAGTGTGTANSYLEYRITRDSDTALMAQGTCPASVTCDPGYNGTVPVSPDLVQVIPGSPGPNGGYVPFFFNGLEGTAMTITWDYCYNSCSQHVFGSQKFKVLGGPDNDGDGVADSQDACPGVQGTLPNGCLPKPTLKGGTRLKKGAKLKKRKLRRGQPIPVTCNLLSNVNMSLTIKRGAANRLGLKSNRVAGGRGQCKPAIGAKPKLKLTPQAKRRLRGRHRARLRLKFTGKGSNPSTVSVPVKIV